MMYYVIAFMEVLCKGFLKYVNLFYPPILMYFSHEMKGFRNNIKRKIKYCLVCGC